MTISHLEAATDNKALNSAKQLFINFTGTLKNLNLYSESHTIYQTALNQLKDVFNDYFNNFGSFKIEIQREQIVYDGKVIHQGESEPNDIALALFRDGVLWIEFLPGMELWEIDSIIKVINRYAKLEDDAEDDIVTALWQLNMPSILYEATEPGLDKDTDIDFSSLKCRPDVSENHVHEQAQQELDHSSLKKNRPSPTSPPLSQNMDLWGITREEHEALRKMIAEEEKLDGTDYVIEVLLYILEKQVQPDDDLVNLLEILGRELKEVLIQGRYGYLANVLGHIKKYIVRVKSQNHFSTPHLEKFYLSLSGEALLGGLSQTWEYNKNAGSDEIKNLKRVLLMLDESEVYTLGPMLDETDAPKIQRLLLEVIGIYTRKKFQLMEKLIETSAPSVIVHLIRVLRSLNNEKSNQTLHALLHHQSERVREEALKTISSQDKGTLEELFNLLDDPDENIKKMVLYQIGQKRDLQTERMLLEYLQTHEAVKKDADNFFSLLRTLGRCGTEYSLPYLHDQLFLFPSLGILRPNGMRYRNAVLVALNELNTKNAAFLANRGSRGFLYNFLRPSKLKRRS